MRMFSYLKLFRKACSCALMATMTLILGSAANANLVTIDDFSSGDLSAYTQTVILDVNGGASNGTVFSTVAGELAVNTTGFNAIEQTAFTRTDSPLGIGDTLLLDVDDNGNQDLGLYVGGTAPVADLRNDYITAFARTQSNALFGSFFGTAEQSTVGFGTQSAIASVFIRRTGDDDFEAGHVTVGGDEVTEATFTDTGNDGSIIGIYTDIRGGGGLGEVDNLRVHLAAIPEPGSLAVLGLGAMLVGLRRRK